MKPRRKSTRVTIADVAAAAGVSIMTVSRVVNRDEKVKATTRKTVEEAIAALNYAPNVAARTLAGGRIKRICLLYGNPSSAYLGELLVGALEAASEAGAHLIVERTDASLDPSLLAQHFGRDWDALIVPPPMSDIAGIRQTIQAHAFPAVFIASARETSESAEIRIDDTEAAREMTQYLIEQGHQRIGFIKGATDQTVSAARYDGYRQALIEAGIDIDVTLVRTGQFTYR
ncbi:MAG: LacI family DNA-binding transcriptional regulator, partial [Pseudomonadota bacterium]